MAALRFEVLAPDAGQFVFSGDDFNGLLDEFDDALDTHQAGMLSDKLWLATLERLLATFPDFIDGYAHLASHWHRQGKPKKALDAALQGLSCAARHIPEGFVGHIEWGHLDNRPYLRALQNAVLAYVRLRRHREAVLLIDIMLARNPHDNMGVRYLLGSEALRGGDHARAREVFMAEADSYPPYFYELALSHLMKREWVAAATALRHGFARNPYIAEMLGGQPQVDPLPIWHGSNFEAPESAEDYLQMYGTLWQQHPTGLQFTRWLFNHSKVLAERAALMACRESLLWEDTPQQRGIFLDLETELLAGIDDTLSTAIIQQRNNRRGQPVWPWAAVG